MEGATNTISVAFTWYEACSFLSSGLHLSVTPVNTGRLDILTFSSTFLSFCTLKKNECFLIIYLISFEYSRMLALHIQRHFLLILIHALLQARTSCFLNNMADVRHKQVTLEQPILSSIKAKCICRGNEVDGQRLRSNI